MTNTSWNLAGLGLPVIAAVIAMPRLIHALGDARFGILALGWMVTGYFALFDFGVGRATTRLMASLRGNQDHNGHAGVFWNSLYVHIVLAVVGGAIFAILIPILTGRVFSIPSEMQDHARASFYWLAFSVPALVLASALRAPLESEHRFDLVNAIKLPISILNYLAPLVVLQYTDRIDVIICVLSLSRWLATAAFGLLCLRTMTLASHCRRFNFATARALVYDGGWLTIGSLLIPLIMMVDRAFISSLLPIASITYYVVPYEMVTKMWILSASLLGAAYPLMSASKDGSLDLIADQTARWLLFCATPTTLCIIIFGRDILKLWIGDDIAIHGSPVLIGLAIGVWINILAQVPLTTLQATGRAKISGIIQLIELPIYAMLCWYLVKEYGVIGAAVAWLIRAALEWIALTYALRAVDSFFAEREAISMARFAAIFFAMIGAIFMTTLAFPLKFLAGLLLLSAIIIWQWCFLLDANERQTLRLKLRAAF